MRFRLSKLGRGGVAAVAAATVTAGLASFGVPAAHADSTFTLTRIAGPNRFVTASDFDTATFPSGSTTVYLAAGFIGHQADALAGSGWGGVNGLGALLTDSSPTVPSDTMTALSTNKVKNITILGGTNAVPASQQSALTSAGYTVTRLAGATRYDTMQALDDTIPPASVGTDGSGAKTAILAAGTDAHLVDALSSGGVAYGKKFPVLLTDTASTTLSPQAQEVITKLGITHLVVVGGTAAIPASQYTPNPTGVTKVDVEAGADRSATSKVFADFAISNSWASSAHLELARGDDGADALASAPYAGTKAWPTVVTLSPTDAGSTTAFATEHAATLTGTSTVAGGSAAIADSVVAAVQAAGQTAATGATARPQLTSAKILSTNDTEGSIIQYNFTKPVTVADHTLFHAYTPDTTTQYSGDGTAVVESNGTSVDVQFSTIMSTSGIASALVLATVGYHAVAANQTTAPENPIGAAPLGTSSSTTLTAGHTVAPDLVSVSGFTPDTVNPGQTKATFTFDAAATHHTDTAYHLVANIGTGAPTVENCTYVSGTGTTTITVTCVESVGAVALTSSNVARGYVDAGAVAASTTAGAPTNPVEAAKVAGDTNSPDLTAVTLQKHVALTSTTFVDRVIYTFDEQIATGSATAGKFHAFLNDTTAETDNGTVAINPSNTAQVSADFTDGSLTTATGAYVDPSAVTGFVTGNPNVTDELPLANTGTVSVTPGATSGPDLVAVTITATKDAFGNITGYVGVYSFDKRLAAGTPTAADFALYDADGTQLTCSVTVPVDVTTPGTTDKYAVCTTYGAASSAAVKAATLGTVDHGAVTDQATGTFPNPEGAQGTTSA